MLGAVGPGPLAARLFPGHAGSCHFLPSASWQPCWAGQAHAGVVARLRVPVAGCGRPLGQRRGVCCLLAARGFCGEAPTPWCAGPPGQLESGPAGAALGVSRELRRERGAGRCPGHRHRTPRLAEHPAAAPAFVVPAGIGLVCFAADSGRALATPVLLRDWEYAAAWESHQPEYECSSLVSLAGKHFIFKYSLSAARSRQSGLLPVGSSLVTGGCCLQWQSWTLLLADRTKL